VEKAADALLHLERKFLHDEQCVGVVVGRLVTGRECLTMRSDSG
jgi:hypothetical protein